MKNSVIGWRHIIVALACLTATPAFAACTVKKTTANDIGTYSPAAVRQTAAPYTPASSGLACTASLLSLGSDFARATVSSAQGFKLISTTDSTKSVSYTLAADAAGSNPITAASAFTYGGGVNLLGLLGDVSDVKIYVRPTSTETIPPGIYKGDFQVVWAWRFCSLLGVNALGIDICLSTDTSTGAPNTTATVSVTLTVQEKPFGVVMSTRTVWDQQSNSLNPRATPGSRQRTTVTVTNPDIATLDLNSLKIIVPTPSKNVVALDGDKTPTNAVVTTTPGSSNLLLTYAGANNAADNVDFSNNANFRAESEPWTYQPAPGDAAAQAAVTAVRFRPQGTMAAQSSFSVSLPYAVN